MPWFRPSTGGGGGALEVHGSTMHDNTVPTKAELTAYLKTANLPTTKVVPPTGLFADQTPRNLTDILIEIYTRATQGEIINENLIFNSTGYADLSGWSGDGVTISEDDFIDDSDRYFIITGNNTASKFTSKSIALVPGQEYTLSFYYSVANNGLLTSQVGMQTIEQVNTTNTTSTINAIAGGNATEWTRVSKTFTATAGSSAGIVIFNQTYNNASAVVKLKRVKLEHGNKTTRWIPAYSDSAINSAILLTGPDSSAFD